ncbi:hypothetical protein Zm00014a_012957 [Zea mays]|uniref:Uncharacterized protein n=1 Tax=Zea mays TaxID=4577 RepID=A0A3L6EL96_MAIZE|nr:hypothetical protein Zm00014a_012957 [Zea mays]
MLFLPILLIVPELEHSIL